MNHTDDWMQKLADAANGGNDAGRGDATPPSNNDAEAETQGGADSGSHLPAVVHTMPPEVDVGARIRSIAEKSDDEAKKRARMVGGQPSLADLLASIGSSVKGSIGAQIVASRTRYAAHCRHRLDAAHTLFVESVRAFANEPTVRMHMQNPATAPSNIETAMQSNAQLRALRKQALKHANQIAKQLTTLIEAQKRAGIPRAEVRDAMAAWFDERRDLIARTAAIIPGIAERLQRMADSAVEAIMRVFGHRGPTAA